MATIKSMLEATGVGHGVARKVTKGKLGDLKFQLNPTNMTHDGGAVWTSINSSGMGNPLSSYSYGKEAVYSFELWYNDKHIAKIDGTADKAYKTLVKYRNGNDSVLFTLGGGFTRRAIILECPITIEAWHPDLKVKEFRASITLKVV